MCFRGYIGRRVGASADTITDSGPNWQLLASAPVIPAIRVPTRELARGAGEPATTDGHPGCRFEAAFSQSRHTGTTTGGISTTATEQHAGNDPRTYLRYQRVNETHNCDTFSRDPERIIDDNSIETWTTARMTLFAKTYDIFPVKRGLETSLNFDDIHANRIPHRLLLLRTSHLSNSEDFASLIGETFLNHQFIFFLYFYLWFLFLFLLFFLFVFYR